MIDATVLSLAIAELGLGREQFVVVGEGVGLEHHFPDVYSIEAVGGRALPIAMGVKLARTSLEVLVVGEDARAIGFGHLPTVCRSNVDIVCVVPAGEPASPQVLLALGASWIGQGSSGEPEAFASLLARAIRHEGFAFLSVTPTKGISLPVNGVSHEEVRPTCEQNLRDRNALARARGVRSVEALVETFLP
jgi:2-oxoglutarate ferredoxin oxidoreductase subunit beta